MNRRLEGKVAIITGTPIEDVVQKIRHYSGKAIAYAGDVSQPQGELRLDHSREGLENKQTQSKI
ncbi:hypothetical protein CEN50_20115 [Fischerella thermalis CCMEE 5268]|uniref:Uncharacterized protein n=1 Tax=Fischerella thermalis CCMEE 5268 TaxID=2019662 RepID=A0A2N6KC01_9CYAN|nr:hypothetical protein [Fischerella thermalis]PLZ96032.1 hypothetical protein CEN50_20115 [Fischerella thermalis CCMEE 5268]